jgi:hypothetical protein
MTINRSAAAMSIVTLLTALSPVLVGMTTIRDAQQRVVGYLDERSDGRVFVRDCQQKLLGWSGARGTYDAFGKKLYDQAVPQLLLSRSRCAATPTPVPDRGRTDASRKPKVRATWS